MKIIGIDFGKKRLGVAISDSEASFAFPKMVIPGGVGAPQEIIDFAHKEGVETIVLGESKDYGGRENQLMQDIRVLERILKDEGFAVVLEQEYGSSVEAERFQGKGILHDASAAAIILQRFLEKLGKQKPLEK